MRRAAGAAGSDELDEAKREALAVLAGRSGAQKAQVMALGGQMEVLTQPVEDAGELRAAVQGIGPGDGHGTFGELGRGMRAMAETVHTPMELHLFSDMQQTNMPGNFADMVMPGNVTLVLHPVGTAATPNWTVESVEAPGSLVDPKKARVIAVVAGHDTPAATRTVSVVVNGVVTATKKVDVPANGRATVAFDSLDVPFGESRCAVKIDSADGFPHDDASEFAVKRADPERVLFVHQGSDARSPLYFGAALAAAAQASFVLQPITPEQASDIDPTKYAFVVLSDVPSVPSILEHTLEECGGRRERAGGGGDGGLASRAHSGVWRGCGGWALLYERVGGGCGVRDGGRCGCGASGDEGCGGLGGGEVLLCGGGRSGECAGGGAAGGWDAAADRQADGRGACAAVCVGVRQPDERSAAEPAFVAFVDQTARYLSGEERVGGARVVDSFVQLRNPANETAGAGSASAMQRRWM
jgi:hypothetical protein